MNTLTLRKMTNKNKTTLNWWQYWIGHCWMTGWQSIRSNFRMWGDLMGGNYEGYGLLKEDDPYTECLEWFWASLNEDDVYPKFFLEELLQIIDDIDSGKEKLIPMDLDQLKRISELLDDVEEDDEEII
jgi:hypothetical protein